MDVAKKKLEKKYPSIAFIDWLFPWHNERPILHTNIAIDFTAEALDPYFPDILAGRIMLWPKSGGKVSLVITPEFISHYNANFPNSIWINISCRGAWTDALGAAFIAKGGGAWYGYTDYVKATYAHYTEKKILEELVNEGKNVKEAFDAAVAAQGANDNDSNPAALKLLGNKKTKIGVSELKNGSFEEPDGEGSLIGWIQDGDGRAIKILGSDSPTAGSTMAIISSGLGLTIEYGSLSQSFCMPEDAEELIFDWNFYSEEFKEYCQRGYDDTFRVTITDVKADPDTEILLFQTSVDSLCGACDGSDVTSEACLNLPLIDSPVAFDRGDAWYTGWETNQTVDISAYKGKSVIIKFYIEDKGDTIYDTAVLIDNIRITTP
jgi:hypothetical protein